MVEICFFFQAEDGIRSWSVTGVQTCALPISRDDIDPKSEPLLQTGRNKPADKALSAIEAAKSAQIGRASCRERV